MTDCDERLVDVLSTEDLPLEVLSTLPRHPDAIEPPPDADAGFATNVGGSVCGGDRRPTPFTAVEQLAIEASKASIKEWYGRQFISLGYRDSGGGGGLSRGRPFTELEFFHPAEPDVTVTVDIYPQENSPIVLNVHIAYLEPCAGEVDV